METQKFNSDNTKEVKQNNDHSNLTSLLKAFIIYRFAKKGIILLFVLGIFFMMTLLAIFGMIFNK